MSPSIGGLKVAATEVLVRLRRPHAEQQRFIDSRAKRKVIRAGRRGGKTVGIAILAVNEFLKGRRVLYATPTAEQIATFWFEVKRALGDAIDQGLFTKNESVHTIERPGAKQRIRAKTAWNADTLRGDYADLLILDEFQLMAEDAWELVGAPMLMDGDGDAVFIYTPPSLHAKSMSKARDKKYAAQLYKKAAADTTGRWAAFHFSSDKNPHISKVALAEIAADMTSLSFRQEIMAEDVDEAPGALWKRENIRHIDRVPPEVLLVRVVTGVDPTGTREGDEAGIVTPAKGSDSNYYVIADDSRHGSPDEWARAATLAYHAHSGDRIVAEKNFGGEMVEFVLQTVDPSVPVKMVSASRGKAVRAEPVAALYEQGKVFHVGRLDALEDEMCQWVPGDAKSPNRLDALVWGITDLMEGEAFVAGGYDVSPE